MSRRGKISLAVFLPAALVVSVILGLRWQAQWHLSAYRKKLIASGEKLTVTELAPKRNSEATNTALFLKLVSTIHPSWQYEPTIMLMVKPGVSRVAWRQTQLMETVNLSKPPTNVWPALSDAMTKNEPTFDEVLPLLEKGGIEFIEDYSAPNLNYASYLIKVKLFVSDLGARATLALHQGRMQEAYYDLKYCLAASQLTAKDPITIDQLVRYACMATAATASWEALQAQGWTDDQLAQLQRSWEQSEILAEAGAALAMERARGPMEFQLARASRRGLDDMLGGNSGIKDNAGIWNDFLLNARRVPGELLTAYPRYWGWCWIWSYRDEQRYLEFMQTMIEATQDAQKGRSMASLLGDRSQTAALYPPIAENFDVARSMTGGIERFITLALRAQTVANMVIAAIALERFRLAHHAYPDSLAQLAPEFAKTVPVDCLDGHDLRYRPNPDGTYLLYSVGEDGVDNGGDSRPEEGRSLSFFKGRDMVWPRPATAEEMQAYEAEQSKPAQHK